MTQITGLIFAGGDGSRLQETSKPMTKLNGKPIIAYGIDALISSGITDITIIRNANDNEIFSLLQLYKDSKAKITILTEPYKMGIHNSYIYFEKHLKFPLISLDCDVYINPEDFCIMLTNTIRIFETNNEIAASVAISQNNPFGDRKTLISNGNYITDYIVSGHPDGSYGGYIYLWRYSPCKAIKEFCQYSEPKESFISYYARNNLLIPMNIGCIWDIDTQERLKESEKILNLKNMSMFETVIFHLKKQDNIKAIALGGSRSRGHTEKNADYDIFCLMDNDNFFEYKNNFRYILLQIPGIEVAVDAFYLEYWGYLFKAKDNNGSSFDISILPINRITEMCIRSTNLILYDPDGVYCKAKIVANDETLTTSNFEIRKKEDYRGLFYFEWSRFKKSLLNGDYWLALKSVERMKKYYIHTYRIGLKNFANTPHCPEKEFNLVDKEGIEKYYIVDGSFITLENTAETFKKLFENLL